MKFVKLFNYTGDNKRDKKFIDNILRALNTDLTNIFNIFNGRIRFGTATDGFRGENIAGEFQIFNATTTTVSASATTEFTISHGLGASPIGFLLINKGGLGNIYMPTVSATSATFVSSTTSTQYTVFLLK